MMASWEEVTCHENHQNWWWDILPIGVLNSRSGSETELSDNSNSSSSSDSNNSSSDSDENKSEEESTSENSSEDEEIDDNNSERSKEYDSSTGSVTGEYWASPAQVVPDITVSDYSRELKVESEADTKIATESLKVGADVEWKSFSLPSISTLSLIDLKSQKPALIHLRKQFYYSLLDHFEEQVLSEEENNSDFSGIYDQPRDNQSPMEVKSNYPSQTFVRHGFGRMSATSKISFDQESDIYNSLEDMGQSEVEENHSKTTVRHCISKFNSNSTPTEATTRTFLIYSDKPSGSSTVNNSSSANFNDSENKAIVDDDHGLNSNPSTLVVKNQSIADDEPVNIESKTTKTAYHSYYVFPRTQGNSQHSPNLLWHQVSVQNNRGRSLSPSVNKSRQEVGVGTRDCNSLTRESSLPKSSLLVKKSDASMPEKTNRIKIKTTPLILSRERVDKAIETLKKSSRQNSPQIYPRVRLPKLNRSESLAPPLRKSIDFPNYSGPQSLPMDPSDEMKEINKSEEDLVECEEYSKQSSIKETPQFSYTVVVAIDFGTTFSGYAYSFTHDPENIHIMRKWEGDDPGLSNQKTPTILLLSPNQTFHSFGFSARDFYHDLDQNEARRWFYFDKFKMILHHNKDIGRDTMVKAANGKELPAMLIFSLTLDYFRNHALRELTDATGSKICDQEVCWVITVPAIWRQKAKQFMREAAYKAGIGSEDHPEHLLLALEPEAASINCRKLRMNQLVPERPKSIFLNMKDNDNMSQCSDFVLEDSGTELSDQDSHSPPASSIWKKTVRFKTENEIITNSTYVDDGIPNGGRYMVVDCGGGTVDITVHEIINSEGHLKELFKATGGPYGSISVDQAFMKLIEEIFGKDIIEAFKKKRPAGFVDLMIAFESRKRGCSPNKLTPLNIALPFSFIDFYRRHKGKDVGMAINKYGDKGIKWVSHGMLRIEVSVMKKLFEHPINKMIEHIKRVLESPKFTKSVDDHDGGQIGHLFLVGGFAESAIVQEAIRSEFGYKMNVIIPQGVGVAVLRGAVLYGLDPSVVHVRRAVKTYGIGVIKPFIHGVHPQANLVVKDNQEWCMDVFDVFVTAGQSVTLGEAVIRRYRPVSADNNHIVLNIFASERDDVKYITDPDVESCGSLNLSLEPLNKPGKKNREIQAKMLFGDTEIKATATDIALSQSVKVYVDFMNESNPKYVTKL